jgi:hypothetical protein
MECIIENWIVYDLKMKHQIDRIANKMKKTGHIEYANEFIRLANQDLFIQFCMECGMTLQDALTKWGQQTIYPSVLPPPSSFGSRES